MIAEQLRDLKAELREFPELAAALLLAMVIGVGFKTAISRNAIGNEFQVHAGKWLSAIEQLHRSRTQSCSAELKQGFTGISESRRYDAGIVMRGSVIQAGLGLIIGIPIALLCVRFIKSRLYDVTATNLGVFAAVYALAVSACRAGLLPAQRAASTDPVKALRTE